MTKSKHSIGSPQQNPKRGELINELKQLQKRWHDLNEQMITSTIDPIEFHYSTQGNEARQRAIFQELSELAKETINTKQAESENKTNQFKMEDENDK